MVYWWVTVLLYAAMFVLSELLRPKPEFENAKPAGIGDFQFPTATEERFVPVLWGTMRQKGPNVVWYGDLRQDAIVEEVKTGLFSSEEFIKGYEYYLGIQFELCSGDVGSLLRVWIGEDEVWTGTVTDGQTFTIDDRDLFGGADLGNGGVEGTLKFFSGSPTQTASSYLSDFQKEPATTGDTPAYRNFCYICPDSEAVYLGNTTSIVPWSFELRRIPTGPAVGGYAAVNSGNDANPVNVIYEILTNNDWGLGIDSADIDTSNFSAAGIVLSGEGNGFTFLLDSPMEAAELIHLVEQQMDGVVFLNQLTGQYQINLARADYDIDLVPQITSSNLVEIRSFSRGSWEDTTNQVRVNYNDRADEYKGTFALAQDMANQLIQDGVNVSVTEKYPGVKDGTLANSIAWRDLRGLSYPLAKASLVVDRTFYSVQPGQVLAFTDEDLDFTKLPIRVIKIDYGMLEDGKIVLEVVQDIFQFQTGKFGDPPTTNWEPPADVLTAFDSDKQLALEAPRALVARDPSTGGLIMEKIWCGARRKGPEVSFKMFERHTVGTPSGDYSEFGEAFQFLLIGQLNSALSTGSAYPLTSLVLSSTPDTQSAIEAAFTDGPSQSDLGNNLVNMILVDDEFMLVSSAQTSGANVQLNNVYRGVLDSVQADHSSGEDVYLVFVGGGMASGVVGGTNTVDVKLLPRSLSDTLDIGDATAIQFTMSSRVYRPYPPSGVTLDSSLWASTTGLEANGSGGEDYGIDLEFNRRDFRTADEVEALDTDAADIFSDFPTVNSTTHEVDVRNDPDGANTLLFTDSSISGAQHDVLRIDILRQTAGVLPTRMRFVLRSTHTEKSTSYDSRQDLTWDFDVTTGLTGDFNFGALDTSVASNQYTATVAGQYDFTLSTAFTAGDVQYSLNGGTWTQLIAGGSTTGNIAGVAISDTIDIRHQSSDSGALKFITMVAAGVGQDGYAVLYV